MTTVQTGEFLCANEPTIRHFPIKRSRGATRPLTTSWSKKASTRWAVANTTNIVVELIRERGFESKTIGLVGAISYQVYNKLREKYPNASFVDVGGKLRVMRTVKSAEEVEPIR